MELLPIETRRAVLRSLTEADVGAVHAILNDEETTAAVSWRQPDLESTARWVRSRTAQERENGFSMWAVELRATGEIVGLCGFLPHPHIAIELGYVIRADHWGQGLASEVVPAALMAATKASLDVFATIRSTNTRSLRVARRAGLIQVGALDDGTGRLLVFRTKAD